MPRMRGLRENVRAAEASGMQIVAFNLCRTAEMALDQQRAGVSAERHRRGVEHGAAGNDLFGLADVGNDRLRAAA